MTSMNEITHLIGRWFAEHNIDATGFTLILNFTEPRPAAHVEVTLAREIASSAYVMLPPGSVNLDMRRFQMNGIKVQLESPVHEVAK